MKTSVFKEGLSVRGVFSAVKDSHAKRGRIDSPWEGWSWGSKMEPGIGSRLVRPHLEGQAL